MAEKNSLWKNIRKKAEQNRRTGAKPKKPTAEMLRQERKIKAKQYPNGGDILSSNTGSYYSPVSNTVYLDPNDNPSALGHELYHKQQHVEGRDRLPDYYDGPLRQPQTPTRDELAVNYYNRNMIDHDILNNQFLYNNPSFNFIPQDVVSDYYTDPAAYRQPWTLEGEARLSETPEGRAYLESKGIGVKQKADGGPVGDDGLYNMQRALELGYTPDETGHWPSVDSETGMWLKSKEHPTAWMEYMHGYALNPEVQKQYQHPVVNPEGYFGENQLQYNLKAQGGPTGGDDDKKKKTRVYTDPREFRIAQQNYNDSLAVSNQSQILIDAYNRARGTNTGLSGTEYEKVKSDNPNPNAAFSRLNKPKPISRYNINITNSPRPNLDNIKIYKEPEEIPVFRKPEIEFIPSKSYKGEEVGPGIIPTPPNVEFGKPNMNNFFEGTYEKYKRSSYEDPMYRVWISGQQQQIVPESEFKKLSDQYLLKDLEAPDPGGNLYDKPKATGGYMYDGGGDVIPRFANIWNNITKKIKKTDVNSPEYVNAYNLNNILPTVEDPNNPGQYMGSIQLNPINIEAPKYDEDYLEKLNEQDPNYFTKYNEAAKWFDEVGNEYYHKRRSPFKRFTDDLSDMTNPVFEFILNGILPPPQGGMIYDNKGNLIGESGLTPVYPEMALAPSSLGLKGGKNLIKKAGVEILEALNPISGFKGKPKLSASSNVDPVINTTPTPWSIQEMPGLHLKSTMSDGAISKIVEPKTGLINVEQALAIIGKESGGADKIALIKQAFGDNVPKKMDFNDFRKLVQDQLIPLERQFNTYKSNYGIDRLGYNYGTVEENIGGTFNVYGNPTKFKTRKEAEEFLKLNSPIENQTLILGNKDKFGIGSSAHSNPEETLGHIHFLRDAETPDILTLTQIQSDAFQGTHRTMPKSREAAESSLSFMENNEQALKEMYANAKPSDILDYNGNPVWYELPDGQIVSLDVYNQGIKGQTKLIELRKKELENFAQKSLLDKNHQERYLQELVNYAGERGDINKIRIPTKETAANVQGYTSINESIGPVTKYQLDNSNTFEEFLNKKLQDPISKYSKPTEQDIVQFRKIYDNYKAGKSTKVYSPEHETILKKYLEQPKTVKKLFGVEPKIVTDNKGNTWYEFDIPEGFKGTKGEIKAFSTGGIIAAPTSIIGAGAMQGSQPEQQSQGGNINPYMYYSGGPMQSTNNKYSKNNIMKYKRGGGVGGFFKDYGNYLINANLAPVEALVGKDFYDPEYNNKIFEVGDKMTETASNIGMNMLGSMYLTPQGYQAARQGINSISDEFIDTPQQQQQMPPQYPNQNVNQGLSFAATGGNINNNSLTLPTMKGRYNNYKNKYSKGGTFHKFGINEIPDSAGLHHQNAYGGVPIGPNAMAEGGEFVLDGNYVISDQVDGMNTQTDEFGRTMAENLKRDLSKYTMRDLDSKHKDSPRRPMDPLPQETINQIKQKAMMETEMARAEAQAKEQERQAMVEGALQYAAAGGKLNKDITKIVEEEYAAAYGGYINPKKYKGLNMPYSSGGKLPKEVLRARVESHMSPQEADAYVNQYAKGGSIHIKESKKGTFTAAAKKRGKSVQEFARQVLANKGNYSSAMVKKANFAHNAAGWKHAVGGPLYGNTDSEYTYAHGGPVVSNVNQGFGLYAQNRGGMMMAQGGNMYANGGPGDELDPEQLKAQGFVEYEEYFYNPTTGQYVDKPSNRLPEEEAMFQRNIERFMQPGTQFDERSVKPLLGLVNNTGIEQMPINTGMTTLTGGVKKPGMENIIGDDSYVEGTRTVTPRLHFNSSPEDYSGKYNLQYVDPYTLGGDEMLDQRYPILDREGNIQTTPEDFARLQTVGSYSDFRNKYFTNTYNQVMSTRDKVRRAYQNKSPYLDNMVDEPAKPNKSNTYLRNLNTPNYVDNQGNTSSILSRRNKNQSTPVDPIKRMQSRNLQQLPTDNTPLSITNNYPESSYRPATLTEEEQNMLDRMSNTAGFIPSDVMSGKLGTSTAPFPYEEGPVNISIPREMNPGENIRFTPPEGSDMIEDLPGTVPTQTKVSDEAIGQSYLGTAVNPNLPKLTFTQSDATKYGLNPNDVNITDDTKVNQPNDGLGIPDYISMAAQAAGPLSQLYYGLKGPDDVNYQRVGAELIDPTKAIILSNEENRRAQDLANYNLRTYAPTSGSFMSNTRGLGLSAGKQRAGMAAGLQSQADAANVEIKNRINQFNNQIAMQEQIDRLQEKDAARTNVTEGLSGVGSSTANVIRDYRINQLNKTIANNIGTNNYKYDPVTREVIYRNTDGSIIRQPLESIVGTQSNTSSTTASTGYMTPVNPNTTTPVATAAKSFKFDENITDKTKGDAFRAWVNKTHPDYAKEKNLWASGEYNNSYIKKAWDEYGKEYLGQ